MTGNEAALRHRLGIPDDAARVLIFAESSHWDPDWLHTSGEYFSRWVAPNLDQAIDALLSEPRRVYSVECMFFLRMYWEARPEKQETVRALVNEGRLRLTSSGVTTADTLIPRTEAILRDWLAGQEWLRAQGMAQEPRLAYFTDSFGCSPALPSLLRAAGFECTALTRVDGMYFPGTDFEPESHFPRPGSSAELLAKELRTLDFVWRGPDGAEVLCHWNAFTYGQGDMLAHRGLTRMYIANLALPSRSPASVARRIEGYVSQLAPLSRTPYLFCPIGFDFVGPIPGLVDLLERYNRVHYPSSGVWAVCAGLDDYLALVGCHRDLLPTLALDPNPYWTGFYTSRPALKRKAHELVDRLLLAERLALAAGDEGIRDELAEAWWAAATANHHDFITGTSPDKVAYGEQHPLLEQATKAAGVAIARLAPVFGPSRGGSHAAAARLGCVFGPSRGGSHAAGNSACKPHERGEGPKGIVSSGEPAAWEPPLAAVGAEAKEAPQWRREAGKVEVSTPYYTVTLSEEAGGTIISAWSADGEPFLTGFSGDLVSYRDAGGLWRMGHEFAGGELRELARASDRPAPLQVVERGGELEVRCTSVLGGEAIERCFRFAGDSPLIRLRIAGRAPRRRTVTVRFATGLDARSLAMDQPGGMVERPPEKLYAPTFWPLQSLVHLRDKASKRGAAFLTVLPGAVACRNGGQVELVALRNATRELAWGVVPLLATPATGHERERFAFECAVLLTASGGWRENRLPELAAGLREDPFGADELVRVSREDICVTAVKPAWRGEGVIVRLTTLSAAGEAVEVALRHDEVREAFLCDARERNIRALEVRQGAVRLTMPGNIATLQLIRT